jgi:hypothetical protein
MVGARLGGSVGSGADAGVGVNLGGVQVLT